MSSAARGASLLLLLGVASCQCGKTRVTKPAADRACLVPLSEHCKPGTCPSFQARKAEVTRQASTYCAGSPACGAAGEIGTCGAYQYVRWHDGYSGGTDYFDARDGAMVGAMMSSDMNAFCDGGSFSGEVGSVPKCEHVLTEDLVPSSPFERLGRTSDASADAAARVR